MRTDAQDESPGVLPNSECSCGTSAFSFSSARTAWVSAPPRSTLTRCFPPDVAFQRPDGQWVRAAHLHKVGGDVLLGPGGSHVRVYSAVTHAPQERDFVRFQTSEGMIVVTSDHEILIQGPDGCPVPVEANALLHRPSCMLYNGSDFCQIKSATLFKESRQVVELCFEDIDAAVLAWKFPGRTPRSIRQGAAVACRGKRLCRSYDRLRTFLSLPPDTNIRCRSAGASADPCSAWSIGSIKHPQACNICQIHVRYLGNQKGNPACKYGAACRNCHAHYADECQRRDRRRKSRPSDRQDADADTVQMVLTEQDEILTNASAGGGVAQSTRLQMIPNFMRVFVLVDLEGVLVHRSLKGELLNAPCDGFDGGGSRAPFYCRPGAVELLQFLALAAKSASVSFAIVTLCARFTCDPILELLRARAGLNELICFDFIHAVDHEGGATYPDGRLKKQFDIERLRSAWSIQTGEDVPEGRVALLHSNSDAVRQKDKPLAWHLPLFCLDEIVDEGLRSQAADELTDVQKVIQGAITSTSVAEHLASMPHPPRVARSYTLQYDSPPPMAPSSSLVKQGALNWRTISDWYCAPGVLVKESRLTTVGPSGSATWAGARFLRPVEPGERMEITIKDHSDIVLRVGWGTIQSYEVGTDEWSWGYGATGKASHARNFRSYGRTFGLGNCVTSVVDRRGDATVMDFIVDGIECESEPAFIVDRGHFEGPLYFAVCGRPGFELELLSYKLL